MKIKKIMCGVLACILAMSTLAGCGAKKSKTEDGVFYPSDIALASIAESKLSEDEMFEAIKKYYDVFNAVFEATGDNVVTEAIKNADGTVVIMAADSTEDSTSKTTTNEQVLSWGSVKEAFAFLYENKQLDLDGNLMFSQDELIAQMAPSTDTDSSSGTDTTESTAGSSESTTADSTTADSTTADSNITDSVTSKVK